VWLSARPQVDVRRKKSKKAQREQKALAEQLRGQLGECLSGLVGLTLLTSVVAQMMLLDPVPPRMRDLIERRVVDRMMFSPSLIAGSLHVWAGHNLFCTL
jgi:hypothetical protein